MVKNNACIFIRRLEQKWRKYILKTGRKSEREQERRKNEQQEQQALLRRIIKGANTSKVNLITCLYPLTKVIFLLQS